MFNFLIVDGDADDAKEIFQNLPANSDLQIEFLASSREPLPTYNLPVYENETVIGYLFFYVNFGIYVYFVELSSLLADLLHLRNKKARFLLSVFLLKARIFLSRLHFLKFKLRPTSTAIPHSIIIIFFNFFNPHFAVFYDHALWN